jgi:putative transposase
MKAFIDDHRGTYGVEPFRKVLPIAPSTYCTHVARQANPQQLPARAKRGG